MAAHIMIILIPISGLLRAKGFVFVAYKPQKNRKHAKPAIDPKNNEYFRI